MEPATAAGATPDSDGGGQVPTCLRCDERVAELRLKTAHGSIVGTYYMLACHPCGHTDGVSFDFTPSPAASKATGEPNYHGTGGEQ